MSCYRAKQLRSWKNGEDAGDISFLRCINLYNPRFSTYTPLFSLAEHLNVVYGCEVFESCFCKLTCLFQRLRRSHVILVALEADQLRVDQCVVDVPVSKQLLDVEDVFGSVVFCRSFPMSQRVETDVQQSGVLKFEC